MKRRCLWLLCTTIVTAFPLRPAAAAAISSDVPLPGGTAGLARALGIDPAPERGRFMFEITRLVYGVPEGGRVQAEAFLRVVHESAAHARRDSPPDPRPADLVPVPLPAEVWSRAIFHRAIAREDLIVAIVADRSAALLCHGLAALDEESLEYFADHPALLTRIYERSAPIFAAFSDGLHIHADRVIPPGGDEAPVLWESVLLEKTTRPDRFIPQLLELNDGRLAYLYDVISHLDPARRAFALGLWMPAAVRAQRFKELTRGFGAIREWHVRTQPFGRASVDPALILWRVPADSTGAPGQPASRALWQHVFTGGEVSGETLQAAAVPEPFDAAWLMDTIENVDLGPRAERLDQLSFGLRVFANAGASAAETADMALALRDLPRYRMLMLTLERLGIQRPAVYAVAARRAERLGAFDGRRGFELQSQFQGALALIAGMVRVGTIGTARAETLVTDLAALPADQGRYGGAIAAFLRDELVSQTAPAESLEERLLQALSGPASREVSQAPIVWEGESYRLDLGASELQRLQRTREKQGGSALDVPVEIAAISRAVSAKNLKPDDVREAIARLTLAADQVPPRSRHDEEVDAASGLPAAPDVHDALSRMTDELTRAERARDLKRAAHLAGPLGEVADRLLSQVLLSIVYAIDIGDPESTVLLAGDVARRHDFGFGSKTSDVRRRSVWAIPRQDVTPGMPWRVTGSLLGLDVGLADLVLRRVNFERVLEAPKITSNERETFALSVSLINPFALRDADLDAIADAVARGRQRVHDLGADGRDLDPLADEIRLEGWRRRALRWTLANEPERVASLMTLTEFFVLGGGRTGAMNAWGMAALGLDGCICSQLTPPGAWPTLLGRPQLGLVASGVADLHLHVAMTLKELKLPAALAKVVLSAAAQDFIDEVRPTDAGDWLAMSRMAVAVSRDRVEDYMAAATAVGPLVPEVRAER